MGEPPLSASEAAFQLQNPEHDPRQTENIQMKLLLDAARRKEEEHLGTR